MPPKSPRLPRNNGWYWAAGLSLGFLESLTNSAVKYADSLFCVHKAPIGSIHIAVTATIYSHTNNFSLFLYLGGFHFANETPIMGAHSHQFGHMSECLAVSFSMGQAWQIHQGQAV
jgi:hypothetical protein